jgi:hypothetical protein
MLLGEDRYATERRLRMFLVEDIEKDRVCCKERTQDAAERGQRCCWERTEGKERICY